MGDGAVRYQDVLREVARFDAGRLVNAYPSAASLVELAHPRAIREEFVPATELMPLYLRRSDAEITWDSEPARSCDDGAGARAGGTG